MDEREATELVDVALVSPLDAFERSEAALGAPSLEDAVASIVLRAMGLAARSVTSTTHSVDVLRSAVSRAARAGRDDLLVQAELTLAGSLYLAGRADEALLTLDQAAARADDGSGAKIHFQRATILAREGQLDVAVSLFDDVLDRFLVLGDEAFIASTLGNRGMTNLDRGRTKEAQHDLEAARSRFLALGASFKVATMDHNLGRVAGRRGDVLTALDRFAAAEEQLRRLGENTAEIQANRLEVLLQAGLFTEAVDVATASERSMDQAGLEVDRAEVALALSLARLGQAEPAAAVEHAERSAALFASQQRTTWANEARIVAMRGRAAAGEEVDVAAATEIARALGDAGRLLGAVQAWSVVARLDPPAAAAGAKRLDVRARDATLEFRLAMAEIKARERYAAGDRSGALRGTAGAIALGRRHQAALAATDVRAGISAQLDAIAQFGLTVRREAGRPWDLIRWVDATTAGSLQFSSAAAPAKPRVADLLSQLRALQVEFRAPSPERAMALLRDQARVQRQLVAAHRSPAAIDRARHRLPRRVGDVAREVRVVQFHREGRRLGAVTIDGSSVEVVELADLAAVDRAASTLRVALLRMISSNGAGADHVGRRAAALAAMLLPPLRSAPRPTVIVPLPRHSALPWSLLPELDAAPVTVAATLRHWVQARDVGGGRPRSIAVLEGVDVLTSAAERERVRQAWTTEADAKRVEVETSAGDVDSALHLLASADVAHVAAHGDRRVGGGRFAQLRFRDGDVTPFDVERLPRAPRLVVLSACEAGLVDPLPGEESTGLSTALFGRGTSTIVAGTLPLPDSESTVETFGRLHDGLAAGIAPAVALFDAQCSAGQDADGLVARTISCFGRG